MDLTHIAHHVVTTKRLTNKKLTSSMKELVKDQHADVDQHSILMVLVLHVEVMKKHSLLVLDKFNAPQKLALERDNFL